MKEIYVYKQMIGGWIGITKEEAEEKIQKGSVAGVKFEMDRGEDNNLKITLLKDHFGLFGFSDDDANKLTDEYFKYVEEITGMVTKPA